MEKLAILRIKFKDHNGLPKAPTMNLVKKILAIRELNKKQWEVILLTLQG